MEAEFLRWLSARAPHGPGLSLGLTDDAALIELPAASATGAGAVVATVDMLTDGVDFRLCEVDPRRVGRKALAVNLSDLAAMAARPLAALVAVALPRQGSAALARELYEGLLPLAEAFETPIAGGDTNTWDGPLAISVTLLGTPSPAGPLTRSGARPGDHILVTGQFGGSLLGHHFDFEPRVREACYLAEHYPLRAGIDVSDGLSLDLSRLADASGCGAWIDPRLVPIAQSAFEISSQRPGSGTPLEHALGDGEDFELILAVPPEVADRLLADRTVGVTIARIGQFVAEPGLWQSLADGSRAPLVPRGYEHYSTTGR
jgi:thiamine-monophosphate kinase